ncbi:MAG: hypothetical protein KatS3mg027_1152 [Bacteroidia bacterium]|nr:MAG: hypothetical protein KatS3mg027_1152 [Bacteroidia bacterium]
MLIAGAGMYAQNGKIQRPANAVPVNMAEREMRKHFINEQNNSLALTERKTAVRPKLNSNRNGNGHQQIATVSATRFSGSMNAYGVLTSNQKPLQYNSDIDIVTFVHRKSQFFTTSPVSNSGSIVTSWSLNKGTTWDSTCIWADGTNLGRYPNGGIYNPPGNTNVNNIYFVGTGPATTGSGWVGNWYASKPYTASVGGNNTALPSPNTQFISSAYMNSKQDMVRYYYTYTTDGVVRAAGAIVNDINATTNLAYSPRGMAIMRGVFNAGSFNWILDSLIYPVEYSTVNGNALLSVPLMAWSNDGSIGYAVMLGVRQGATGTMRGIQPIVYKTTNNGATWTLLPQYDFTLLDQVDNRLPIATGNYTYAIPFFSTGEGVDVTVDAQGRLHLVGTVVSAYSDHVDSLFYTYAFNSGGGCGAQNYSFWYGSTLTHPTIMDFVLENNNTWNGIVVDSMATEGTSGGDNTCSQWDASTLDIDARIQVSRNDAGNVIFYSWTETDTTVTGHHFNVYPDLYMKAYDINTNLTTSKTLVIGTSATSPPAAASGIFWHYMSPRVINVGSGTYEVPFTFSADLTFGGTSPVDHFYISGAQFGPADFVNPPLPLSSKNTTTIAKNNVSANIYPNPTNNVTQLVVNLEKSSDIHVEIMNALGQVINSMDIKGEAGQHVINVDLSNETAGVYFYNVTTNAGKTSGKIVKQ